MDNGEKAVNVFECSSVGTYDAVLMDIRMPVMDGLTATKYIRSLKREDAKLIPIIAMTANAYDEDIQKSKDAGINVHLAKPIDPKVLYHTLKEYLCIE